MLIFGIGLIKVVDSLDSDDAASIRLSQESFGNPIVPQNLAYILSNFSILPNAIKKLETQGLSLAQSLDLLSEVKEKISQTEGIVGQVIQKKLDCVLKANPGIGKLVIPKFIFFVFPNLDRCCQSAYWWTS